jgi:hypothetical protein
MSVLTISNARANSSTIINIPKSTPSGIITWLSVNSNTTMQPNTGYFLTQGNVLVSMLLPSSPSDGDISIIRCVVPTTTPAISGFGVSCIGSQQISISGISKGFGQGFTTPFVGASVTFVYSESTSTWRSLEVVGFFN